MGLSRFRAGTRASLLGVAVCVSSAVSWAESAPRTPTVVSGSGVNESGLYTASGDGAVFELPSRARLTLAPHTTLRVFPVPQALQLAPGAKTTTWSFALQSGRVDVELAKNGHSAVLASVGKLSAVVTAGHVAILADGDVTVANVEGEVRTLLADHWQTVPLGSLATLSRDNPSVAVKPGIPAPVLNGGQRMFFAANDVVAMRGFHWASVPGAEHYELRVRRLADGKVLDQRRATGNELSDAFSPVEPGRYGLTLRAVDARGLQGSWGPEVELRVIGVLLPPGGYSTAQAIFLGTGQQVQFTNTSGLEMTYLGAGRYFPAANGATLYRNTTTVVGFRLPGALDIATARLEPRGVYADVNIGPKRALWPRDAVSIDIQLKSKSGDEIPSFLQVVPKVTLGLEPLDVTFERNGNVLHAVVPPSSTPGPWVVRVDVADQYGVPLGHDFLEIASQPRAKAPAVRIVNSPPTPAAPARAAARPPAADATMASSN
ncbi:MAG TPA: hypothetical protein VK745_17355 [Polyangiaceae bacterium]|jgi:hypothetical protein|nr:hypothetical protein [Polyangiaceae bacterium]